MLAAVRHRGPDGDGRLLLRRVDGVLRPSREPDPPAEAGLAHARLSIVDLSPDAAEPMGNERGDLWLTFNGEIYNHLALRPSLVEAGHAFRSRCDAEVILHGYESEGARFFRRLEGMYAFALLDLRAETLLLCRDAFGIKPLYLASLPGHGVAFSSELSGLFPVVDARVDPQGLSLYLGLGYLPPPRCLVRGVEQVEPGACLLVQDGRVTEVDRREPPMAPSQRPVAPVTDAEAERVVLDSVRAHLLADVEVGTFLSGGVDSSLVTAAMVEVAGGSVQAFTVAVEDPALDESAVAARTAAALGVRHHVRRVSARETQDRLPGILAEQDEPLADPSLLPTRLCAELAAQHVKVVLSGDGGDELFGGYTRHRLHRVMRLGRALPRSLGALTPLADQGFLDRAYATVAPAAGLPPLKSPGRKLRAALQGLAEPSAVAYGRTFRATQDDELALLGLPTWPVHAHLVQAGLGFADGEPLSEAQAVDLRSWLPGDILRKVDRATMAVGLEARVPLICDQVAALAARLPARALLHQGVGKRVLRRLVERRLGRELAMGPKRGFGLPAGAWLRGPLKSWREETLKSLERRGFLAVGGVRRLQVRHDGGQDLAPVLWALCALEAWLQGRGRPVRP
jgi:asparagine synthase (glutamine-hydrolysing)